jgi:C4-type Zn-finger protein
VVSEHATIIIEELNLEIPPKRDKGYLNTIEGILHRITEDLQEGQEERKVTECHTNSFRTRIWSHMESCKRSL